MPVLLTVDELEPGMRLAESFTCGGRVMLTAGRSLHRSDINAVRQRFPFAMLQVDDPILENVAKFEDDSYERTVASKAQSTIARAVSDTAKRISRNASLSGKDFAAMEAVVLDVMRYLAENPVSAALLTRAMSDNGYLADHTGAVFYLAMVMGSRIQNYIAQHRMENTNARNMTPSAAMDLTPLALGVMFMDLGMYSLVNLYDRTADELTDQDRQLIADHPICGADMLPTTLPATARTIVRTHHENMEGSGYPYSLPGDKIHIFSRIVRICDSYAAATSELPHRYPKSPARAMWEMSQGPLRRCYDPVLVKMFGQLIQPFPIGAKLKLTNGAYGVLVRYNRKDVFRPTVIIAYDEKGRKLQPDQLHPPFPLDKTPHLRIVEFAGENLEYLYRPAAEESYRVKSFGFTDMYEAMVP